MSVKNALTKEYTITYAGAWSLLFEGASATFLALYVCFMLTVYLYSSVVTGILWIFLDMVNRKHFKNQEMQEPTEKEQTIEERILGSDLDV